MASAVVTSKGQTTIPKAVREHLKLKTGDRLEFVVQEDGTAVLIPKTVPLSALKGCLPRPNRALTVEEMNQAVLDHASERARRSRR